MELGGPDFCETVFHMQFEYQANGMLLHYIQGKTDISIADILKIGKTKTFIFDLGLNSSFNYQSSLQNVATMFSLVLGFIISLMRQYSITDTDSLRKRKVSMKAGCLIIESSFCLC